MRRLRRDNISLPQEGGVKIGPESFFTWGQDIKHVPSQSELLQKMRSLRGLILAESFRIENDLILIALANEFGHETPPEYFERELRYREEHSFGRKVDRSKPIIRARRAPEVAEELIQRLAETRDLRNLCAHYPSWLEPINDLDTRVTVGLSLHIADRTHEWSVDDAQEVCWKGLADQVARDLRRLREEMLPQPQAL